MTRGREYGLTSRPMEKQRRRVLSLARLGRGIERTVGVTRRELENEINDNNMKQRIRDGIMFGISTKVSCSASSYYLSLYDGILINTETKCFSQNNATYSPPWPSKTLNSDLDCESKNFG